MPPVLTEAARPSKKRSRIAETKAPVQDGARALHVLEKHVLMDGFKIVIDLKKSGRERRLAARGQIQGR